VALDTRTGGAAARSGSPAPWPLELLDPVLLRRQGLRAVPFRQFVVKLYGRCNLACDYCYLYTFADQGWRQRPGRMARATLLRTVERIAEHAAAHRLPDVGLVLHGGEPLLGGAGPLLEAVHEVRRRLPEGCRLRATVQTNGVLLTRELLRELAGAGITVGVSLDGGSPEQNRHRVDHAGRSSWAAVARGVELLRSEFPESYAGLLLTVDRTQDPVAVFESVLAFAPPLVDLLLPHGNWSDPPPGLRPTPYGEPQQTPYGDWLCTVFDRWWGADREQVRVRLFEEVLALLLGLPGATESLGTSPAALVVVETDGAIGQVDTLASAYPGASATGLDVHRHPFDLALDHPGIVARQLGRAGLSATCLACPLHPVCGGGQYPHRYRAGEGFHNPSVYCADLELLIRHVHRALRRTADAEAR
jgi:uncharacterized protein